MSEKLQVTLFALTEQVVTGEDKKNSLINLFDRIGVKGLPALQNIMTIYFVLKGKPLLQDKVSVFFYDPDDQVVGEKEISFKLSEYGSTNVVLKLEGFPLEKYGSYKIKVKKNKIILGSYVFEVFDLKDLNV